MMRHVPASREAVDALLAGRPTRIQIAHRRAALVRLLGDVEHFAPWPALAASLREDIARIDFYVAQKFP